MKLSRSLTLLLLLVFTDISIGRAEIADTAGQPKMIKTQGTNEYANVHCGLQDKAGDLWFGTTGEGVYRYDGRSFINYTVKDGLSDNNVWCIYEDNDGILWLGTGDGLCRYDPSVPRGAKHFSTVPMPGPDGNTPGKSEVWSILQDKTGQFWVGTDHGVYRYDGKRFTRFLFNDSIINNSGLQLKHIQSIVEDKAGHIWFASWKHEGVSRYDGRSIIHYTRKEGLGDDMIHSLLEDKTGGIWAGARNGGVYRYDGTGFIHFTDKEGLGNKCINSMLEDRAGNIWFATEPAGVWRYDPSATTGSKTFMHLTTKDGLSHNSVFSIVSDNSGKLWFGTRGIGLCNYDGKIFTNFSE